MNNYKKLEKEIEKIIAKSPVKEDPSHSKSTREWVLVLKPDADEALQIAALAHDIERGFMTSDALKSVGNIMTHTHYQMQHSDRSAKIIGGLLRKHDFDKEFDKEFIKKVEYLILNHEFGGDSEADILRDADSISFFDNNLPCFFKKYNGKGKVCENKIKFMYDRMSGKAKRIVKKFKYKNPELNKIFKQIVS